MGKVILQEVGSRKMDIIAKYREVTGANLSVCKSTIDRLEAGEEIIIDLADKTAEEVEEIVRSFIEAGAKAVSDRQYRNNDTFTDLVVGTTEPTNNIVGTSSMTREETLNKLIEVGKVAQELEKLKNEKYHAITDIQKKKEELDRVGDDVPKNYKLEIKAFLMCCFFVTIPFALLWYKKQFKKYKESYKEEHKDEIELKKGKYVEENIIPLERKLEDINNKLDSMYQSGMVDNAIDYVGEDMFYNVCIQDLYNIVKSRRADNIKEALNHYDDVQYKARMEEIQASIQNATEIAAIESAKQTEYAKAIEKNTHQAATSAKATAYHTRQIDKNTRRFR